jgi:hypothetical protein
LIKEYSNFQKEEEEEEEVLLAPYNYRVLPNLLLMNHPAA